MPSLRDRFAIAKKQVSHFFLGARGVVWLVVERLAQLGDLLLDLRDDIRRGRPFESHGGRALADLVRAEKRGQALRHAAEGRMALPRVGALLRLERVPSIERRLGRRRALLGLGVVHSAVFLEDVRMAPQQLLDDRSQRVVYGEQRRSRRRPARGTRPRRCGRRSPRAARPCRRARSRRRLRALLRARSASAIRASARDPTGSPRATAASASRPRASRMPRQSVTFAHGNIRISAGNAYA